MNARRSGVDCPLPGCQGALIVDWHIRLTLAPADLDPGLGYAPDIEEGELDGWRVECSVGHVVLLPTDDDPYGHLDAEGMSRLRELIAACRPEVSSALRAAAGGAS